MMNKIYKKDYSDDPIRAAVQDAVVSDVERNPEKYIARYNAHPESKDGTYICADLFKETIPQYSQNKDTKGLFNNVVHNSAAVLASEQFSRVVDEIAQDPSNRGKTALFLTGSPGAGKTSAVLNKTLDGEDIALIYEGQLAQPDTAIPKIKAALDAGLSVEILAVRNSPETALNNTLHRFEHEGRGASLNVMATIIGKTPDGLESIHKEFGNRVHLMIYDVSNPREKTTYTGWQHLDILRKDGNHDQIKERLTEHLNDLNRNGKISEQAFLQASGQPLALTKTNIRQVSPTLRAYGERPGIQKEERQAPVLKIQTARDR